MSDEPVKECEVCGEPVKRLLFPVAIQFKGKGFYTTDYARRNNLGHAGSQTANEGNSESSGGSESAGSAEAATPPATKISTPVAATAASSD
jgi:predicted nucleic acid-binding Zn ribbon protein